MPGPGSGDISADFYREHARHYAKINLTGVQRVFPEASHSDLEGNHSLLLRLQELVPGSRGLDAGCGAGAHDVAMLLDRGYDMYGIDVVPENIECALDYYPDLHGRVWVADLSQKLETDDGSFDFVLCNAVIQHLEPDMVYGTTLAEFARILRPQGVLQLMFKKGNGVKTVYDHDYGVDRSFQLYREQEILDGLRSQGMDLVQEESPTSLGGIMYFTNPKGDDYCVFYARKKPYTKRTVRPDLLVEQGQRHSGLPEDSEWTSRTESPWLLEEDVA